MMSWEWIPPTFIALLAVIEVWRSRSAVKRLHVEINSRMDELLRVTRVEGEAEGHDAGVRDERARRARENGED